MAALGNQLAAKIWGKSEAEKALMPWWDYCNDLMVYCLVITSVIAMPTAIKNGTPLKCTLSNHFNTSFNPQTDQKDNPDFVNENCTQKIIPPIVTYFPYVLLFMPITIIFCGNLIKKICKPGEKLDAFYKLSIKKPQEINLQNDYASVRDSDLDLDTTINIARLNRARSSFFRFYLCKLGIELAVAISLLVFCVLLGIPAFSRTKDVNCDIKGYSYECFGHPTEFYLYILYIACAILGIYICCSLLSLWPVLTCPTSRLGMIMKKYPVKNKDVKLLLNILQSSSGFASSLRVLALINKNFSSTMKLDNLKVNFLPNADNPMRQDYIKASIGASVQSIFSGFEDFEIQYIFEVVLLPTERSYCVVVNSKSFKAYYSSVCTSLNQEFAIRVVTVVNGQEIICNCWSGYTPKYPIIAPLR